MSLTRYIANEKDLMKYCIKLTDFKVQCIFCKTIYTYLSFQNFQRHIARHHKKIFKYENEKKQMWSWICFKYLNKLYSQCTICNAKVLSTSKSVENHLSSHSTCKKQQENHIFDHWSQKYFIKKSDFVVKCNICHRNVSLSISINLNYHIKIKHSDKLKNTQETHDTARSSERVSALQMDTTTSLTINIATITLNKQTIWKYYIKLSDFKAQCMFCEKIYMYLQISSFKNHVTVCHKEIAKYEKERKLMTQWMCFKYLNELYSQCIICDAKVLSTSKSIKNHLSLHYVKHQANHIFSNWPWKYCTKKNGFMVECNICDKNIFLAIPYFLNLHTKIYHSDQLKNTQETHNTAGSSERVLVLQNNTTSTSPKDYCIETSNFWNHIKEMHTKIFSLEVKFQNLHGPTRIYFKYFNSLALKCIICDESVLFLSECLEDHVRSHSKKQLKKHTFNNWLWKYCSKSDDLEVACNICHKNICCY